jgi:hypothetical protein
MLPWPRTAGGVLVIAGGIPTNLPESPDLRLSASVGEVTECGDSATAAVKFDGELGTRGG